MFLEDAVDRLRRDVVVLIVFDNFTALNCFLEAEVVIDIRLKVYKTEKSVHLSVDSSIQI